MEHWLEWEIAQWVHHHRSIRRPIAPWANALTTELYLAPHVPRICVSMISQKPHTITHQWRLTQNLTIFIKNYCQSGIGLQRVSWQPIDVRAQLSCGWSEINLCQWAIYSPQYSFPPPSDADITINKNGSSLLLCCWAKNEVSLSPSHTPTLQQRRQALRHRREK